MIKQLRPFYTPEQLPAIYSRPYNHTRWEDHKIRVRVTIDIARIICDHIKAETAADLSCGDGAILAGLQLPRENCIYGDFVRIPQLDYLGTIEDNITRIPDIDLFILSETLEHVEQPSQLLHNIRSKTRALILTTPEGETGDENPEHYWGWDRTDIRDMLTTTGFTPRTMTLLDPHVAGGYTYQIWGAV